VRPEGASHCDTRTDRRRVLATASTIRCLQVGLLLAAAACGGGGGGSSSGALQVLIRNGDVLPGNFTVGNIEEANIGDDHSVALIASSSGVNADRGIFLRVPGGDIQPVVSPATQVPQGVALSTLHNLVMAPTGEFIFQAGSGLDSDSLFVFANGQVSTLAAPGQTPAGFRILGDRQIASGGVVAFTAGVDPCSVDSSTGVQHVRCTLEVFFGNAAGVTQVKVPNNLTNQDISAVSVLVNNNPLLLMGLPGKSNDPALAEFKGGQFESLIASRQAFADGTLFGSQPRVVSANGDIILEAKADTNGDGAPDDKRILLLSGGQLTTIAKTGEPAGTEIVLDLRALDVDDTGRLVFTATFGNPGEKGSISLRTWAAGSTQEIAFEGEDFGQDAKGNSLKIIKIEQVHVAGNGDVMFVGVLGTIDNGTPKASKTQVLRSANGQLSTMFSTADDLDGGKIVGVGVDDLTNQGDLLSIVSVDHSANRVLTLLPRQ
jgi:hypothetical protein